MFQSYHFPAFKVQSNNMVWCHSLLVLIVDAMMVQGDRRVIYKEGDRYRNVHALVCAV